MKKISFRIKIEVIVVILFLLLLMVVSVVSVTRTITDTHDDIKTFIVNSNGNYWEATGANIQVAIDNLGLSAPAHGGWGGPHGTVWLPGNTTFTISSTIVIGEHVTLDMGGSEIQPNGDFDIIQLKKGSQLVDGVINVSGNATFSSACIIENSTDDIGASDHIPFVYNMRLVSDGHRGKGIYLYTHDPGVYIQEIFIRCNKIQINCFEYGIYLYHPKNSNDAYINGNQFSDIQIYNCTYPIRVWRNATEVAGNCFYDITVWCTDDTEYIVWNNGKGNIYDVVAFNWNNNSGTRTSYNFSVTAPNDTYGAAHQCFLRYWGGGNDIAVQAYQHYTVNANRWTFLNLENSTLMIGNVVETRP